MLMTFGSSLKVIEEVKEFLSKNFEMKDLGEADVILNIKLQREGDGGVKALVWFWLIDETLSANLVYQSDYEIGSTTPSDEAMTKIMTMVIAW